MTIPDSAPDTKPSLLAAILLWALEIVRDLGSWPQSATAAIALLGSGRSQAYEMLGRLKELAGDLHRQPGRPEAEPAPAETLAVMAQVRDFLLTHPGAARTAGGRSRYNDAFRRFVIDLASPQGPGHGLTRQQLAAAVGIPSGTLEDWLRGPEVTPAIVPEDRPTPEIPTIRQAHVALILSEWPAWEGAFLDFCRFLQEQHRVPYGPTFIGTVLAATGLRDRRPPRQPEAPWSSGTFRLLFPGFQWIGDGTTLAIRINGQLYVFNAEGVIDPASGALVALDVSDTEDEQAVIKAFCHGTETTGEPPLALTLDNRPSNLTTTVEAAIAPTELLASTPARGQSKAPLEGAFGLLQQTAPPMVVSGANWRAIARSILQLVLTTYAWARNGKPRKRLGGRAPRDAYQQDRPTPEQIDEAKEYIIELQRRQEQIRRTREARLDPVRLALLDRGLQDLGIHDPDRRIARSLASFSEDAIVYGLAAFAARREAGTLPDGAEPHRYLGGIIRNRHVQTELELTAKHLLEQRLRLADLTLEPLAKEADRIRETHLAIDLPRQFIDQALRAEPIIGFRFWASATARSLAQLPEPAARSLYAALARRVAASFTTDRQRRADLLDAIAGAVTATA
jgi:hypothetical protein